jgi:hypothetical protein
MDDDKKTLPNDTAATNAEYVDQTELDDLEGQEEMVSDDDSKHQLRKAIEGNDDNAQDEPLDEENY